MGYRLIYGDTQRLDVAGCWERITRDWFDICESVPSPNVYPLALDQALWLLSRNGCFGTDGKMSCARRVECPVGSYCVFAGVLG